MWRTSTSNTMNRWYYLIKIVDNWFKYAFFCAPPTEYMTSVGYRSSATGGSAKGRPRAWLLRQASGFQSLVYQLHLKFECGCFDLPFVMLCIDYRWFMCFAFMLAPLVNSSDDSYIVHEKKSFKRCLDYARHDRCKLILLPILKQSKRTSLPAFPLFIENNSFAWNHKHWLPNDYIESPDPRDAGDLA